MKGNGDAMTILELLDGLDLVGLECTCCGGEARKQCADHDTGYGVCDRCLAKYGKQEFCQIGSCRAHEPEVTP